MKNAARQRKTGAIFGLVFLASLPPPHSIAQILYQEDFDTDHTANWVVNSGPSDDSANFHFDYSTIGIAPAPRSAGTTRGLKLVANASSGIFGGLSVSPIGQSFTGDYMVTFDIWWNFNGPAPVGGSGSTQLSGAGIGTAGTVPIWAGATTNIDCVFFAATGDGNSAADYRAYSSAANASYPNDPSVYAAPGGDRNSSNAYYTTFGGNTAPAAQIALFPQQTGVTGNGAPAFRWHTGRIFVYGDVAYFTLNGIQIATVDLSTVSLGGGNILFIHSDVNATSSTDPNDTSLLFGLIDNVEVKRINPAYLHSIRENTPAVLTIKGYGVPGRLYSVQRSTNILTTNWSLINVVTANTSGDFQLNVSTTNGFSAYRTLKSP